MNIFNFETQRANFFKKIMCLDPWTKLVQNLTSYLKTSHDLKILCERNLVLDSLKLGA
jgi:hypothetical protein